MCENGADLLSWRQIRVTVTLLRFRCAPFWCSVQFHILATEKYRHHARNEVPAQIKNKSKGLPQEAEVAQGVPGRLRPRIFLIFRHYKGGRSSAKRTGRIYPRRNHWYSLSEAESTSGHMVLSGNHGKIPSDTTGNRSLDLQHK